MESTKASVTLEQDGFNNATSAGEKIHENLELHSASANARLCNTELELTNLLESYAKLDAEYKRSQVELCNVEDAIKVKDEDLCSAQREISRLQGQLELTDKRYTLCQKKLNDTLHHLSVLTKRADEGTRKKQQVKLQEASNYIRLQKLEEEINLLSLKSDKDVRTRQTTALINRYEQDLDKAYARANHSETTILQLQEGMRLAERKLKTYESNIDKARLAETEYKKTIKDLQIGIQKAESRATKGEQTVHRLHGEIDNLTAELKRERDRLNRITFEMEETLAGFT